MHYCIHKPNKVSQFPATFAGQEKIPVRYIIQGIGTIKPHSHHTQTSNNYFNLKALKSPSLLDKNDIQNIHNRYYDYSLSWLPDVPTFECHHCSWPRQRRGQHSSPVTPWACGMCTSHPHTSRRSRRKSQKVSFYMYIIKNIQNILLYVLNLRTYFMRIEEVS